MTDVEPAEASEARIECATALRELGHAIVGHAIDDAVFREMTDAIRGFIPAIEGRPPRARPTDDMKVRYFNEPPDGAGMSHYADCVVSGPANPMGIAIACHREAHEAVATVTLGAAFEGAPGRAHGGVVAAIFDDLMGFALAIESTPAYTGRLTVSYLAPTPLATPLEFRAHLDRREDRKLWLVGTASSDGQKILEAEGLFIAIPLERLGGGQ